MRHEVPAARILWLFLVALVSLVHCLRVSAPARSQTVGEEQLRPSAPARGAATSGPKIAYGTEALPGAVEDMRAAILEAVQSGDIEDLRHAYERNELKPDLGAGPVADPVAHWRQISGDGEGREILAILAGVLDAGYVIVRGGRDAENARIYVWPYFAEVPIASLSKAQQVELLRLVSPATLEAMRTAGRYTYWRVAIGADGTWHSFRKQP
jgi:hypothetical protein